MTRKYPASTGGKKGKGSGTPPPEFKSDEEMVYNDDLSRSLDGWNRFI